MNPPDKKDIRIYAEPTPNPDSLKFTVDRPILDQGSAMVRSAEQAAGSPLAERLFALGDVTVVFALGSFITVTKRDSADWRELAFRIGEAIREHILSGKPAFAPDSLNTGPKTEVEKRIAAVIDGIRPAVQGDGGDILYVGYHDGVVSVQLQGACRGCPSALMTLKMAVEARVREAVPEVREVVAV
jgi:Fe-S cluster biogenesis protein NfuA